MLRLTGLEYHEWSTVNSEDIHDWMEDSKVNKDIFFIASHSNDKSILILLFIIQITSHQSHSKKQL